VSCDTRHLCTSPSLWPMTSWPLRAVPSLIPPSVTLQFGQAAPDPVGPRPQRELQALAPDRAAYADRLSLGYLFQGLTGFRKREEQLRVSRSAGGSRSPARPGSQPGRRGVPRDLVQPADDLVVVGSHAGSFRSPGRSGSDDDPGMTASLSGCAKRCSRLGEPASRGLGDISRSGDAAGTHLHG